LKKKKYQPGGVYSESQGNPSLDRFNREQKALEIAKNRARAAKQGEIRQAEPKRSALSKAWAVATNPMTALSYKIQGKNIPDNFDRGPVNNLDIASSILNPLFYLDQYAKASKGAADLILNPNDALQNLSGVALNSLGALPVINELAAASKFLPKASNTLVNTYKATGDLPFKQRVRNAVNTAPLKIPNQGDVKGHSYFSMHPDEVREVMSREITGLLKGSYSFDGNMSKNSAPLFWSQAAKNSKDFTIIRPGVEQGLNWSGIQGKRVINALPEDAIKYMPYIDDYVESVQSRVDYLRQLGTTKSLKEAARLEKEGVKSAIIADLPFNSMDNKEVQKVMTQFMNNYKPVLDNPILEVNRRTGLNFPLTKITSSETGLLNYTKDRVKGFYNGELFNQNKPNFQTTKLPPQPREVNVVLKKGGPVIDPMGQWSHPGKHTIVPTKDGLITMKGVSYPVFGQDETGYSQMMMPGGEYNFPGKTIYEIPMKKTKYQTGGQMYRDVQLPKFQSQGLVNLTGAANNLNWNPLGTQIPQLPATTGLVINKEYQAKGTPVKQDPIVPVQQVQNLGEWVPKTTTTWQPNVEGAGMVLGAMGMIANQMNNVHDSKIYNNSINRATTDAQFSTFNPTLKRGYIDQNSGRMAPTNQTLSQFTNRPAPSYYGSLPIAQMGGLPDMNIPDDPTFSIDAVVDKGLPPLPTSFIPSMAPSSIPSLAPSKVSIDEAEFLTYMAHQQGEAGIKAITKAARSGQDWREFYKGKENLDTNMRSNINQQEFFKKYDSLNPATFLDYWKNKFNKQSSKWGKKSTQYDGLIEEVAPQFGLNPAFVKTVIGIESGFDSNATNGSHKGLLQLNDKEARKRGVKDPYNPVENILAGLQMMAQRRDRLSRMSFKEGGEYDLTMEEVARLRKLGYDVDEIS